MWYRYKRRKRLHILYFKDNYGHSNKGRKKIQTMLNALDTLCEDVRWHPLFTSHMFYFNMEMIS